MLANGGRVTNHELVKHFKSWLTHPTEKDTARQKFKEYVNRLATMKQEDGEKYLMLKKRYYPNFEDDEGAVVQPQMPRRPPDQPPPPPSRSQPPPPVTSQPPPRSSSPSLLDEIMANYQPLAATMSGHHQRRQLPPTPGSTPYQQPQHQPQQQQQSYMSGSYNNSPTASQRNSYVSSSSHTAQQQQQRVPPPPYRGPPIQAQQPPYRHPPPPPSAISRVAPPASDLGLPLPSDYGLPAPRHGVFHPPTPFSAVPSTITDSPRASPIAYSMAMSNAGLPPPPMLPPKKNGGSGSISSLSRSSSAMSIQSSQRISEASPSGSPASLSRGVSNPGPVAPPLPARNSFAGSQSSLASSSGHGNVSRQTSSDDKENYSSPPGSGDDQITELSNKNEKISVKERTKTFNRMASEGELLSVPLKPVATNSVAVKRRNSRAVDRRGSSIARGERDDDSSSISTLDQTAKQWMIRAAQGDYHSMVKMLLEDPRLAKHKDFISGYTALHWAAKHGNLDMVKLLAGNYSVPVNVKSHGGYTPLHMACQFGHQEVFSLMVKVYKADPHIRDNAGKKPRQYMMAHDQSGGTLSLSSDTFRQLKDRRRNRTRQNNDKNSGILRFGSLSVKVKKTTEAFNNYFGARSSSSDSLSMPYMGSGGMSSSTNGGHFGSRDDSSKMPPPRFAPIKKRKSKRAMDYHSSLTSVKSAPVTPTETSPIKEEGDERRSDSDSEYGFNSQWSTTPRT